MVTDSFAEAQQGDSQSEIPFLIAHVVRGEAAFDIAIKMQFGQTEGWLIPTSGHRAYPYWTIPLQSLSGDVGRHFFTAILLEAPTGHPDHYAINNSPTVAPKATTATPVGAAVTLEELGLDL